MFVSFKNSASFYLVVQKTKPFFFNFCKATKIETSAEAISVARKRKAVSAPSAESDFEAAVVH